MRGRYFRVLPRVTQENFWIFQNIVENLVNYLTVVIVDTTVLTVLTVLTDTTDLVGYFINSRLDEIKNPV